MDEYQEAVQELFTEQGFETIAADQGFIAAQDETELHVLPLQDPDRLDGIEPDPDRKTIAFVTGRPEDPPDGIELSVFRLEDEDEPDLPETMPSSYEVIGHVAVLNLEDEQLADADEIADAVMEHDPSIETVIRKSEPLSGEFRVGEYEKIAGDGTETTHVEHGARFRVDPTEVYFSERLGHERERITELVDDGERVAVWFAGVAPYSVLIARKTGASHVDSIEKNPVGCEYAEQNIALNGVEDRVTSRCGDVREIAPDLPRPDRIIMPLPGSADAFIGLAMELVQDGGTVHYYRFAEEDQTTGEPDWDSIEQEARQAAAATDRSVEILHREICGHYAPYIDRVCLDLRVRDA